LNYTPTTDAATAPDDVSDLIERHREAWRRANNAPGTTTNDQMSKLVDAHMEIYDRIQETTPTTMVGHVAKARYLLVETIKNGMEEPIWSDSIDMLESMFSELEKIA
jgi:hypothetical protein